MFDISDFHITCLCLRRPLSCLRYDRTTCPFVNQSGPDSPLSTASYYHTDKKMSDYGDGMPPPDAEGLDRPSENEDHLDDTAQEFTDPPNALAANPAEDSDDESLLSEVDEAQFADFDPSAVQVAPDFETLQSSIKVSKRKRADGDGFRPTKRKEGTREKIKKNRRRRDSDEGFSGGEQIDGKRRRKHQSGADGERPRKRVAEEEEINEETLPPEERRRRALDRAMDAALKKSGMRKARRGEIVCYSLHVQHLHVH